MTCTFNVSREQLQYSDDQGHEQELVRKALEWSGIGRGRRRDEDDDDDED